MFVAPAKFYLFAQNRSLRPIAAPFPFSIVLLSVDQVRRKLTHASRNLAKRRSAFRVAPIAQMIAFCLMKRAMMKGLMAEDPDVAFVTG